MLKPNSVRKIISLFHPETAASNFIEATTFDRKIIPPHPRGWPQTWVDIHFKKYPRQNTIKLPKASAISNIRKCSLASALLNRASGRAFAQKGISLHVLSDLLFYSVGIKTVPDGDWNKSKRMYPSGGARYPIEVYIAALKPDGFPAGLYHYNFKNHSLEILQTKNLRHEISNCFGDVWVPDAGIVIFMSAMFGRSEVKYKSRGLRHIFIEAGHIGQNFYLNATALGLSCCGLGGHVDHLVNELLDLDGWNESIVNTIAIGEAQTDVKKNTDL